MQTYINRIEQNKDHVRIMYRIFRSSFKGERFFISHLARIE